jgi:hypothetical protein
MRKILLIFFSFFSAKSKAGTRLDEDLREELGHLNNKNDSLNPAEQTSNAQLLNENDDDFVKEEEVFYL